MTAKSARQVLLLRRPDGSDDGDSRVRQARAVASGDPQLLAETSDAAALVGQLASELHALPSEETAVSEAARALAAKRSGERSPVSNPATIAVGVGFLLLIAVLVWNFLGRAGTFPDEAVKIATAGAKAGPEQFDPVEEKAGALQDWFALKGFDAFHIAPGLEGYDVVGVRIFKVDNELVAQAAVPENLMYFYSFPANAFGIDVSPEKAWRVTQADRTALALRQENGVCFLVAFRGTEAEMKAFLEKSGALNPKAAADR